VSQILVATADDVIEQLMVQCWLYEARGGDRAGARVRAERALERLLSQGLSSARGRDGTLLVDPYAANNIIRARVGQPTDDAWADWLQTTRRNAVSLPTDPYLYRFTLRREWHSFAVTHNRPVVLRLPLPLRYVQQGPIELRLLEPASGLLERRDAAGRVEVRIDPSEIRGPIVAELRVSFLGGELRDLQDPPAPANPASPRDDIWLRDHEGFIVLSPAVIALAEELASGQRSASDFVHAAWDWLIAHLHFGDVHRCDLQADDPLGGLLRSRLADCVLGSSLLIALCRARGIPARLVSGFLLHPANLGPHWWAEVKLAADRWVPFDFASWCYCAGDPHDPVWGRFFCGRVDARFLAEVAPREFTGWGSAHPPERWFRLERLRGDLIEHSLHRLPDGSLFKRDQLGIELLRPALTIQKPGI